MDREFWQARWDEGRIGFHQDDINPYLQRHWPALKAPNEATVFVPLCGKSRDMLWLRDRGHTVIGVELVHRAVAAFFEENALPVDRRPHGPFTLWQSNGIRIYQGDFFDLSAGDLAGVGAVYDRASLIALPPPLRRRYGAHLRTLLPAGIDILLVTMDYPQVEMDGPPFAVSEREVEALYKDAFTIEHACSEDILDANPRFREQGLSSLIERVYVLRARPSTVSWE